MKRAINHHQVEFILGIQGWFNIQKSVNVTHYVNKLKGKKTLEIITIHTERKKKV